MTTSVYSHSSSRVQLTDETLLIKHSCFMFLSSLWLWIRLNKHTLTLFVPVIFRSAALHLTVPLHGREEEPAGVPGETQTRRPPLRTGTQPASNDERGKHCMKSMCISPDVTVYVNINILKISNHTSVSVPQTAAELCGDATSCQRPIWPQTPAPSGPNGLRQS